MIGLKRNAFKEMHCLDCSQQEGIAPLSQEVQRESELLAGMRLAERAVTQALVPPLLWSSCQLLLTGLPFPPVQQR